MNLRMKTLPAQSLLGKENGFAKLRELLPSLHAVQMKTVQTQKLQRQHMRVAGI
jgi:hypothetical protein